MNKRERIYTIIDGGVPDRCGFWMGNPDQKTWDMYTKRLGMSPAEIRTWLGDDFAWFYADMHYKHPEGRWVFDIAGKRARKTAHGDAGPLADVEDVDELDQFEWPNPDYLDFSPVLESLCNAGDLYRASGMWTCFYHNVMDLFGMENYLCNMHENPELVHAVTDRVCSYYYEGNRRFFEAAGDLADAFFFGNDFGTQIDLICGPDQFDEFIMPWFRKFTELGHAYGRQVILHSCGAISRVVDRLIDAGVDCLHPIQARAKNMNAEYLAEQFGGRIAFLGGIDTQDLMVNGTPDEIRADVERVKAALGPQVIISPSHEAILPNVPLENVVAMAEAATGERLALPV